MQKLVLSSMNSVSLGFFGLISPPLCKFNPRLQLKPQHMFLNSKKPSMPTLPKATDSNIGAPVSEGAESSVIPIEEVIEKDWSVLDSDETSSTGEFKRNIESIISAGKVGESSRVLVSTGSEEFVDSLMGSIPCKSLLVLHDSLLILVSIKEKYDKVKCWQGEIVYVPEKWAPFDAVFLYFLPALPVTLDEILGSLAKKLSPGARVIISHPQGRGVLEQQRQMYPDIIVSDLPDKTNVQRAAAAHSFDVAEFVDEPGFYLAVLICSGA